MQIKSNKVEKESFSNLYFLQKGWWPHLIKNKLYFTFINKKKQCSQKFNLLVPTVFSFLHFFYVSHPIFNNNTTKKYKRLSQNIYKIFS
jgi:hypothetical protein